MGGGILRWRYPIAVGLTASCMLLVMPLLAAPAGGSTFGQGVAEEISIERVQGGVKVISE